MEGYVARFITFRKLIRHHARFLHLRHATQAQLRTQASCIAVWSVLHSDSRIYQARGVTDDSRELQSQITVADYSHGLQSQTTVTVTVADY